MFQSMSRILRLEPASKPQNLRAEPQKLERATANSSLSSFCSHIVLLYLQPFRRNLLLKRASQPKIAKNY